MDLPRRQLYLIGLHHTIPVVFEIVPVPLQLQMGFAAGPVTLWRLGRCHGPPYGPAGEHVLSCCLAGTMVANGSGQRLGTARNIAAGWVFTFPAAGRSSGLHYWPFHTIS